MPIARDSKRSVVVFRINGSWFMISSEYVFYVQNVPETVRKIPCTGSHVEGIYVTEEGYAISVINLRSVLGQANITASMVRGNCKPTEEAKLVVLSKKPLMGLLADQVTGIRYFDEFTQAGMNFFTDALIGTIYTDNRTHNFVMELNIAALYALYKKQV